MLMLRKAKFGMDCWEGVSLTGYTCGETWNGWECPLFTKLEALRIVNIVKKVSDGRTLAEYNKEFDTFLFRTEGEDAEAYAGRQYDTEDGVKTLYDIGSRSWTWDEIEDDLSRKWYNFETMFPSMKDAMRFMLKSSGIKYELSAGTDFWHFEIFANDDERQYINEWLDENTISEVRS